ncbi:MAG: CT253 family lipoprotein [Chlamydiota bacterium]
MKVKRIFSLIGLLCTLASCAHEYSEEFTRYYEDGRAKPNVVIAPIIDTSSITDLSWSLPEELLEKILAKVALKSTLYVNKEEGINQIPYAENPFGQDLSWIRQEYAPHEFVVFLEIAQHEIVKQKPGRISSPSNLNMAVRLRIVDIRGPKPTIVLQELIKDSFYINKNVLDIDYAEVVWGSDRYRRTPMHTAHERICKEITTRLNDYILLAKSRFHG